MKQSSLFTMGNIFWTSDTHFGHANIIKYCNRPFESVAEMDDALITNWNSIVKPNDTIYHLGDISFYKNHDQTLKILKRLNGNKILIRGNHDEHLPNDVLSQFSEIYQLYELKYSDGKNNRKIVMCHYPMLEWNGFFRGSFMLYGHVHGKLDHPNHLSCDVGVDSWNYFPVSWEDLKHHMKQKTNSLIDDLII